MSYNPLDEQAPVVPSLRDFSPIPVNGNITVCEINTQLHTAGSADPEHSADASHYTHLADYYFPINATRLKPFLPRKFTSIRTDAQDESFLLKGEDGPFIMAIWDGWTDNGIIGVIRGLRQSGSSPLLINTLTTALNVWVKITSTKRRIGMFFFPHLKLATDELIDRFAPVRNWRKSWIRAMAWHPHVPVLAIALKDDSVRVFPHKGETISLLKTGNQKMVSSLSWRAYTDDLAVGTEEGILIWQVDYTIKPGSAKSKFLTSPGHCPVTSVDYSTSVSISYYLESEEDVITDKGYWLLSASAADASMIIWDAISNRPTALHRFGGGGVPRARWSPQSTSKIFSTSPTSVFRLWMKEGEYKPKRWTTPSKHVEAFCWSNCGTIVLFVSDFMLYSINLNPSQVEFLGNATDPVAVPLFDLTDCLVPQLQSDLLYKVGGQVVEIAWDETGKRLAIIFADSDVIALFRVENSSSKFIFPSGFIRGHDGEFPLAMAFQKGFKDGALLAIAWSTERVQYFPMIFAEHGIGRHAFQQESHRLARPLTRYVNQSVGDFLCTSEAPDDNIPFRHESSRRSASFKLFSS